MKFMDRVDSLMKERGVTGKQVMSECGLSKNSFSNWRSAHAPSKTAVKVLADYFGVSVEYLTGVTDERDKKSPPPDDGSGLNESEQKLIELFHKVPEDKQKMVIDMIRVALESL